MSMARAMMPKNNLVDSIQPRPLNSILLCTFLVVVYWAANDDFRLGRDRQQSIL